MSRDHELMKRHVEALYTHDAAGRLRRVREHNGAPAPRFFLGRTAGGWSAATATASETRYKVSR